MSSCLHLKYVVLNVGEDVEKGELIFGWWNCKVVLPNGERMEVPQKTKNRATM